jgi:hypothetical protein
MLPLSTLLVQDFTSKSKRLRGFCLYFVPEENYPRSFPSVCADFACILPLKRIIRAVFRARARILLGFCS